MCGIAGIVGPASNVAVLRDMCATMRHRGPDDYGEYLGEGVALGMRRLSIIDVANGRQPVWNEDGTVAAIFNGEIYNFQALRRFLEGRGHRFSAGSDTECLVHLYEEYGDSLVDHLRGMFAFAIWDRPRHQLLLARDRVGKKPLYYFQAKDGSLLFSSELKGLLQSSIVGRSIDPGALRLYLDLGYVPAPRCMLDGVRKVQPGHVVVLSEGVLRERRYWELTPEPTAARDIESHIDELESLVLEATKLRTISERPIGAFLSGGVDSSLVLAAMARSTEVPPMTFSIGFDDARYDERRYARSAAAAVGSHHFEMVVRPDIEAVLPSLTWYYDEPFADSSMIPTFYLARMASEHVTVALTGDGGDEGFAGYDRYLAVRLLSHVRLPPGSSGLRALGSRLTRYGDQKSIVRRVGRGLELVGLAPREQYARTMALSPGCDPTALCSPDLVAEFGESGLELMEAAFDSVGTSSVVTHAQVADVAHYLPGDLLVKMDIATMAHSLEARSPLLDHVVLEYGASLPDALKVRRGEKKRLLRALARRWLPREIINRPKMGFAVPISQWLRVDLHDLCYDVLTDSTAQARGYFRPVETRQLLDDHMSGRQDHSSLVWALMQLELWHRTYLDRPPGSAPPRLGITAGDIQVHDYQMARTSFDHPA